MSQVSYKDMNDLREDLKNGDQVTYEGPCMSVDFSLYNSVGNDKQVADKINKLCEETGLTRAELIKELILSVK